MTLKTSVERVTGPLNTAQFTEVMDLTTTDILVNNVTMGKRTSISEVVKVAVIAWRMLQRFQVA